MNARERLLTAMNWGEPDRVPLTCYEQCLPRGRAERIFREAGMAMVVRLPAHKVQYREVEITSRDYWENGHRLTRRTVHTPVGEVSEVIDPDPVAYEGGGNEWVLEHFIKGPDDYRVIEFMLRDEVYVDNYEYIRECQRRWGDEAVVYARMPMRVPIQHMLYLLMGHERFALDYYFDRDRFDALHEVVLRKFYEMFELAANSPVEIVLLPDNITSSVVGEERYRKYLQPIYASLHERLSGTGKMLGVHMDGLLSGLKGAIAESKFDILEALTPPPMGDVSLAEARRAWPGKALWINFTSSMHIEPSEDIEEHTRQLLAGIGDKRGFAISVTENAPIADLERSLGVIARVLRDY